MYEYTCIDQRWSHWEHRGWLGGPFWWLHTVQIYYFFIENREGTHYTNIAQNGTVLPSMFWNSHVTLWFFSFLSTYTTYLSSFIYICIIIYHYLGHILESPFFFPSPVQPQAKQTLPWSTHSNLRNKEAIPCPWEELIPVSRNCSCCRKILLIMN